MIFVYPEPHAHFLFQTKPVHSFKKDEMKRDHNLIQVPGSRHLEGLLKPLSQSLVSYFLCSAWGKGWGSWVSKWVLLPAAYTRPLPKESCYISWRKLGLSTSLQPLSMETGFPQERESCLLAIEGQAFNLQLEPLSKIQGNKGHNLFYSTSSFIIKPCSQLQPSGNVYPPDINWQIAGMSWGECTSKHRNKFPQKLVL